MKKFLFVLVFAALAVQASASDFEFNKGAISGKVYGKLDFATFYQSDSKDLSFAERGYKDVDGSFNMSLGSDSRVGTEVSYGKLSGVFEVGANNEETLRLYYVKYDLGNAGAVSFGKQGTIASYSFGQEAYEGNCLIGYGAINDFRSPSIIYSIKGFEVAIVHSGDDLGLDGLGLTYEKEVELGNNNTMFVETPYDTKRNQYMPRIELAYTYSNDSLEAKVYGAYAHYGNKVYDFNNSGKDRTFEKNLYLAGLGGTFNVANASISMGAFYGLNLAMSGMLGESLSPWFSDEKNKVEDVNSWGAAIGLGYTIAEKYTPQVGFGYTASNSSGWANMDNAMSAYLNVILQFTDNFALIPEVSWFDEMKGNKDDDKTIGINNEGYRIYAGLIARVTF